MDAEHKQAFDRLEDRIKLYSDNITSQLTSINQQLTELRQSTSADHDELIRVQGKIEQNAKDLTEHKEIEATFGRGFSKTLAEHADKHAEYDKKFAENDKRDMRIYFALGVIVIGGNQGIEILKSMFFGG